MPFNILPFTGKTLKNESLLSLQMSFHLLVRDQPRINDNLGRHRVEFSQWQYTISTRKLQTMKEKTEKTPGIKLRRSHPEL